MRDLVAAKTTWIAALEEAESFLRERSEEELGCLYYNFDIERFVQPSPGSDLATQRIGVHFGAPGGVLPQLAE